MERYAHHKYIWRKPFGYVNHHWELVCDKGGLHFHVSVSDEHGDTAGLETHYKQAPEYMEDQAPNHLKCEMTGGHCWHDGTSLYATEQLWPTIKALLKTVDHEMIFKILEREADSRFYGEDQPDDSTK